MGRKKTSKFVSRILVRMLYYFSYTPLTILYGLSSVLSWLLYHVFRYRLEVVRQNLKNSFPEKTPRELKQIERNFYHHFSDVLLEVIKLKTMDLKDLKRRCYYTPESIALLDYYFKQGRSVVIVMGHLGNWEWAGASFPLHNKHQVLTAYRPLRDKVFDRDTLKMRERTGNFLATMKNLPRDMIRYRKMVMATALIADQNPPPDNAFWVEFLHQDTPFFKGSEILSRKFNTPLIWAGVKRVRRGHYHMYYELITETPQEFTSPGNLTAMFAACLERDIENQPESWLWSHRRWKHHRTEIEKSEGETAQVKEDTID